MGHQLVSKEVSHRLAQTKKRKNVSMQIESSNKVELLILLHINQCRRHSLP